MRFGCCLPAEVGDAVEKLLRRGRATLPSGHHARMVVFGATRGAPESSAYDTISMKHVVTFLQEYLREHWEVLRQAQFKDPAFGFLMTLEKALRGSA